MKKLLIIVSLVCILLVSGCTKPTSAPADSPSGSRVPASASPTAITAQPSGASPSPDASVSQPAKATSAAANPFFFQSGVGSVTYSGVFLFNDAYEGQATLQIKKVEDLKLGTVYELKLDPIEGVPAERLSLGYFYVQKDKIYKTDPSQESLGTLETDELPCACSIVCQEQEVKDQFEGEPGFHQYITVDGDRREYHSYNDQTETGYYESFTWEKGKGLVGYRSGYGAERDSMELKAIKS